MADEVEDEGNNKPMVHFEDGVWWYRASALGQCTTAMIAVRSGFAAMAPPKKMQDRFNEGHLHEPDIVRRANTEFGLEIFDRQKTVEVMVTDTVGIRGHIDGTALGWLEGEQHPDDYGLVPTERRTFEAKTMSGPAFKRWRDMEWDERWRAYPGYAKQLTVYCAALGLTDSIYAVKDKESGEMLVEPVYGLPWGMTAIKTQILAIEAHVRRGDPIPDSCTVKSWPCPVYYIGPCGEDQRESLGDREKEIVTALGQTLKRASGDKAAAEKVYVDARDAIKKHLPDGGKFNAADGWKVTFTKRELKGTEPVARFDMTQFAADHPELIEEYTTTEEVEQWTSERLTVTPPKEWSP